MPKYNEKPEPVDIEEFIAELDMVMSQIELAKKKALQAQKLAHDGKVPMYGMFSWRRACDSVRSLRNSFKKSWPLIQESEKHV